MASSNDPFHGQQILPFYLVGEDGTAPLVRGRLASIGRAATSILDRHDYPLAIASLQAEALAIAACLSTFMKFDGVFTLQAKGDGQGRSPPHSAAQPAGAAHGRKAPGRFQEGPQDGRKGPRSRGARGGGGKLATRC